MDAQSIHSGSRASRLQLNHNSTLSLFSLFPPPTTNPIISLQRHLQTFSTHGPILIFQWLNGNLSSPQSSGKIIENIYGIIC